MFRSLFAFVSEYFGVFVGLVLVAGAVCLGLYLCTCFIREYEAGLVIKRFGRPLPPQRIIAIAGEAGFQAHMLAPGWHFGLWRWQYKVVRVPLVVVAPGDIGLVVAADGAQVPADRILGRVVDCDDFQDAAAFLRKGGERGRQLGFLRSGTYRINPALFQVILPHDAAKVGVSPEALRVLELATDTVGIVTTLDGRPIDPGDLAGPLVRGHESFQNGQAFIDAGGRRGLQEELLLSGSWNLNPWFVQVECVEMTEIPIGYVGVVVSYVGDEHVDLSGDHFTHGDLVSRGSKGVWIEPLLPGKHPVNTRVMRVERVPTTNIVLNWASRTESHQYDERLSPITVRSQDGFAFSLDVSQIIHIGMKNAPRVISRVGSMQNLVDHVLQPTVANYFRNSAQEVTVLDFLSARSERQQQAFDNIKCAVEAYDVECIDTLIGDIVPPAELMKTQTDRKIAEELKQTYDVQCQAQVRRQELERETAVTQLQSEVVRSEQSVRIAERNAASHVESAKGDATAVQARAEGDAHALRLRASAEADALRMRADAEAEAARKIGEGRADAYRAGVESLGTGAFAAMQLATVLAEHNVKLVPEIAVGGAQSGSALAEVLIARMLAGGAQTAAQG